MSRDALARRLRHAPPEAGQRCILTGADFLLFEAIDRHGPLPTHYLYEFTRHVRRDYANLQYRLTNLYNGDAAGSYLTRPPRQFESYEARYQHSVYGLAARAKVVLAERGTLSRLAVPRVSPFVHQLMTACVASSLELAARARGITYISREEIIRRASSGGGAAASLAYTSLPIATSGKVVIPDDLFGLKYPEAGFRFFALEADRNTESVERRSAAQTSFGEKIRNYRELLRSRAYQTHWGIPNLTILTVTTNARRAQQLCTIAAQDTQSADRFAFAVEPCFGSNWRVPKRLLTDLLDQPWITARGLRNYAQP